MTTTINDVFEFDNDIPEKAEKGGFVLIPEGDYIVRLKECPLVTLQPKEGNPETKVWRPRMVVEEGDYTGQEIRDTIFFTKKAQVRVFKFMRAFGAPLGAELDQHMKNPQGKWAIYPDGSQEILIGQLARVTVVHKDGNKPREDGSIPKFANITFNGYAPVGGWPEKAGATAGSGAATDSDLPF